LGLFPFSTLRRRLLCLVLLAVIPGFLLICYSASEDWGREKAGVHERALLLARLASSRQERMIENGFQFLFYLARLPETQKPQSHLCSKALGAFLEDNPHYANIGVADPEGNVLCSAFPLHRPVNIAFRPEFKQVVRTRKFTVGGYRSGVIAKKPILPLYYPDFDPAGRVGRVIFATLDLGWLNKFAGNADLPPDSTLTVIDQDGIVLIRHPDPDRWVGKSIAKNPFIGAIQSGRPEGLVESADLDGVPRFYAYTPFGASGEARAYLAVGISTAVAYGPISRVFKLEIILLGVVTLTALGLTWIWSSLLVLRPVNALVHSLGRVSGGDLTSRLNFRSAPREIRGMAVSFNQMAEAMERQDAARTRVEEILKESEERYRSLFIDSIDGILLTTPDGGILDANPEACRILGYSREEVIQIGREGVIDRSDPRLADALRERERTGKFKGELTLIRKGGTRFSAEISTAVFKVRDGKLRTSMTLRDVTARKAEEEREKIHTHILQSIAEGVNVADDRGIIVFANPAFEAMFGYEKGELIGKPVSVLNNLSPEENENFTKKVVESLKTRGIWRGEVLNRRKDGTGFVTKGCATRLGMAEREYWISVQEDISERKRAEDEKERLLSQLRKRRGDLQSLNRRLVEAQESERRELVRELHDTVGQALTVLALNLNIVKHQLPPQGFEEVETRLGESLASVAEVVRKIRDVMADLHPPVLEDHGLKAALHWYVERFERQTGIKVLFQGEQIAPRLPHSSELALFRITQEGLTNVARHSGAKEAQVILEVKKKRVRLSITDQGAGFDASRRSPEGRPRGLGLATMRERAEAMRAELQVFSLPGRGTRVLVTIGR
jgi:PAS domain S-box-containing protein